MMQTYVKYNILCFPFYHLHASAWPATCIVAAAFDQKRDEDHNNGLASSGDDTIAINLRNTHAIANMKLQWKT
jgi:hypothetical protein